MTRHHTPTVEHRRTFGQDFKRLREQRRISFHDLAHLTQTNEDDVRDWESGKKLPTRAQFSRLTAAFKGLLSWKHEMFTPPAVALANMGEGHDAIPISNHMITTAALVMAMPANGTEEPLRFGPMLAAERMSERLTQEELAKIIGVSGQAVSWWEIERDCPIQAHYDALIGLFPRLATVPKPSCRDIDKPSGGAGDTRMGEALAKAATVERPAPPPVAPLAPGALDAALSFGAALAAARVAAGLERLDLAQRLKVSRRVVKGWELDERLPIPEHLARLLAEFPGLPVPPDAPVPPLPPPEPVTPPETFGRALKREREHAGMLRTDLGAAVGLSHHAVQTWEHDRWPPKPEMYARLLAMFPALAQAPKPANFRTDTTNAPGETMAQSNVSPLPTPIAAPSTSNVAGWISLLTAVRRVEGADVSKTIALLREADRAGVTVADLLRLLTPEGA